jgi:beta-lactamase superfamily II metal-dependent hydrolase
MYHFNLLSILGPISTLLLYPAATLLTLAGFAQLAIALAVPILNPAIEMLTNFTAQILSGLAILLGKIPGSAITVTSPPLFLVIIFLAVLFAPRLKHKILASLLILTIYLSSWLIGSRTPTPWLYVSGPGQGQCIVVNTGRSLAIIDPGASQMGRSTKTISQIACSYLAQPAIAILTSPDQKYFNDLWPLAGQFPKITAMVPESFECFSTTYEPVTRLMTDSTLNRKITTQGTTIEIDGVKFKTIFLPPFNDYLIDNPSRTTPGGIILIEYHGSKILAASALTPMSCRLILTNYPQLRAQTLIVSGSVTPCGALENLIVNADIKKIAIDSPLNRTRKHLWNQFSQRTGCQIIEIFDEGGFMMDLLGS